MKDFKIIPGYKHMIILENGKLYGKGLNTYGELGLGKDVKVVHDPELIFKDESLWKAAAVGFHHTLFINSNDELYGTGRNHSFQLGLEDDVCYFTPVKLTDIKVKNFCACGEFSLFVGKDKKLYGCGDIPTYGIKKTISLLMDTEEVKDVYCNYLYITIALENGKLMTLG